MCCVHTIGMGRKIKSYNVNEESASVQKNNTTPRLPITRLLYPIIEKVDIKKYSIQKNIHRGKVSSHTGPQDNLENTNRNVPSVSLSLDASQQNVDLNDSDSEEIPIKVPSAQQKEARRLARLKQLEKMKTFEEALCRQNRYEKRTSNIRSVKLVLKTVKWKKEDLFVYHFYHNESEPSTDTD